VELVLGTFKMHEQDTAIVEQLRAGLESRTVIGQAQGILMERERITAEAAFAILRTASQNTNVKLRDIAVRVVDTGEDPRALGADASR
jgi:AmiR/NasT family two-component response regulator